MQAARIAETPEQHAGRLRRDADFVQAPVRPPRRSEADRLNARRNRINEQRMLRAFPGIELAGFNYDPTQDWANNVSVGISTLSRRCQHCNALSYPDERKGLCCADGKVKHIEQFVAPPPRIQTLWEGDAEMSRHFLDNDFKYNSLFCFTSFGTTHRIPEDQLHRYEPMFTVRGQPYYLI